MKKIVILCLILVLSIFTVNATTNVPEECIFSGKDATIDGLEGFRPDNCDKLYVHDIENTITGQRIDKVLSCDGKRIEIITRGINEERQGVFSYKCVADDDEDNYKALGLKPWIDEGCKINGVNYCKLSGSENKKIVHPVIGTTVMGYDAYIYPVRNLNLNTKLNIDNVLYCPGYFFVSTEEPDFGDSAKQTQEGKIDVTNIDGTNVEINYGEGIKIECYQLNDIHNPNGFKDIINWEVKGCTIDGINYCEKYNPENLVLQKGGVVECINSYCEGYGDYLYPIMNTKTGQYEKDIQYCEGRYHVETRGENYVLECEDGDDTDNDDWQRVNGCLDDKTIMYNGQKVDGVKVCGGKEMNFNVVGCTSTSDVENPRLCQGENSFVYPVSNGYQENDKIMYCPGKYTINLKTFESVCQGFDSQFTESNWIELIDFIVNEKEINKVHGALITGTSGGNCLYSGKDVNIDGLDGLIDKDKCDKIYVHNIENSLLNSKVNGVWSCDGDRFEIITRGFTYEKPGVLSYKCYEDIGEGKSGQVQKSWNYEGCEFNGRNYCDETDIQTKVLNARDTILIGTNGYFYNIINSKADTKYGNGVMHCPGDYLIDTTKKKGNWKDQKTGKEDGSILISCYENNIAKDGINQKIDLKIIGCDFENTNYCNLEDNDNIRKIPNDVELKSCINRKCTGSGDYVYPVMNTRIGKQNNNVMYCPGNYEIDTSDDLFTSKCDNNNDKQKNENEWENVGCEKMNGENVCNPVNFALTPCTSSVSGSGICSGENDFLFPVYNKRLDEPKVNPQIYYCPGEYTVDINKWESTCVGLSGNIYSGDVSGGWIGVGLYFNNKQLNNQNRVGTGRTMNNNKFSREVDNQEFIDSLLYIYG